MITTDHSTMVKLFIYIPSLTLKYKKGWFVFMLVVFDTLGVGAEDETMVRH